MHVVLRADGSSEIGYGHLIRTSALSGELLQHDTTVTVATTTPQSVKTIFLAGVDIIELRSRDDPEPFVGWLETTNTDIVFTDAYPVDTAYQQAIREHVPLAVLQDDARHAVCADLFINGNLYAPTLEHEFIGDTPKQCLGTDFVLLRREIRERASEEPIWRTQPERAIIIMGGSDIAGLTPTVVRAFDGCDLRVDAIVGPGCSTEHEQTVRDVAAKCSADVHITRDPDDLVNRIAQADFAVSTASSTTYELLALGTPIVSIPIVDNQEPIAAALRTRDAATVLQRGDDHAAFHRAITEYVDNTELRRQRQARGRELVDTRGAERVAETMIELAQH